MSPEAISDPTEGRIAILGAGPVGLDAALAAVDAGRPFRLYELAPHPAGNIRLWGHVKLFTPWEMNVSPRMRRHMEAAGDEVPDNDVCPTGDELCDRLLDPVAALPSIAPNLRTATRVVGVARSGLLKHQEIGTEERARHPFRLVLRGPDGKEWTEEAAAVIDATGTYSEANALGDGGVPAPGEWAASRRILRTIPDVSSEPSSWAGKRLLVVGAGHSAQTAIRDLAELVAEHGDTRVVWALKREEPEFELDPDDPLPDRSALT
ncbi:MAG: flavoprotein, partial [Thermoanaerobaculia bacterium]|nr:flavoprotein [Thermoanaerobaculia bacterium]